MIILHCFEAINKILYQSQENNNIALKYNQDNRSQMFGKTRGWEMYYSSKTNISWQNLGKTFKGICFSYRYQCKNNFVLSEKIPFRRMGYESKGNYYSSAVYPLFKNCLFVFSLEKLTTYTY